MPRTRRARPVRFSVSTGLRLLGHGGRTLLPFGEEFFGLENFRALQMADFGCKALDAGGDNAQRCEEHGVPVARDNLR